MKTLKNIVESFVISEQAIGTGKRFQNFKPKAEEWIISRLRKITKLPLTNRQVTTNSDTSYGVKFVEYITMPNTFYHIKFTIILNFIAQDKEYPIIKLEIYANASNNENQPIEQKIRDKYPFLVSTQISNIQEKFTLFFNNYINYKSKQELSSRFASDMRAVWKGLFVTAKDKTKKLMEYVKQNYASKTAQKKGQILQQIKDDMGTFRSRIGGERNDLRMGTDGVTLDVRHLGHWVDDEEDHYDDDDDSWREDNDQQIWADGEYKKYFKLFTDWAKNYPWYKKVKLDLDTSEKNWCEFSIRIKQ